MSETRYWKIGDLPPAVLRLPDLMELPGVASAGMLEPQIRIGVGFKHAEVEGETVEEILSRKNVPAWTNSLTLEASDLASHKSTKVTLYRNFVQYHIRSDDETWFLGKISQVEEFFGERRPWYRWLQGGVGAAASGGLLVLAIFGGAFAIGMGASGETAWYSGVAPAALAFLWAGLMVYNGLTQKLFPYVRIELVEGGDHLSNVPLVFGVLTVITLIVQTVATVIMALK